MIEFTLHVNFYDLERETRAAYAALERRMQSIPLEAARAGADHAKQTKRYTDQSGELTGSIGAREVPRRGNEEAAAELHALAPHASFINDGTRPHEIRGNPLLTFRLGDGTWVTTRVVNHPGTDPDFFMDRGEQKAEQELVRLAQAAAEDFSKRVER